MVPLDSLHLIDADAHIRNLREQAKRLISEACQAFDLRAVGCPLVKHSCEFMFVFDRIELPQGYSAELFTEADFDYGVIAVFALSSSSIRSGIYRIQFRRGSVILMDANGLIVAEGGWRLSIGSDEEVADIVDCFTTSGGGRVTICCKIEVGIEGVGGYKGQHCFWFTNPFDTSMPAKASEDFSYSGIQHPLRFDSVRLSIKNKSITSARKSGKPPRVLADLRPALDGRILMPGRNLFYTDGSSGLQLWLEYDGENGAEYVATNRDGESVPVRLVRGESAGIAICHVCVPGDPPAPQGIGDCHVILCDPVFRIPRPPEP